MIAFSAYGEVALGNGMAAYLTKFHAQPISTLARWIVDRKVIHFYRLESLMIPTFQFQPDSGQVRISVLEVIAQLKTVLDDAGLAKWFCRPHSMLDDLAPVCRIHDAPDLVFEAARATHFART